VNPGVELPRSFIRGVLLLAAIYVLINAALLYSLDMTRLASENLPLARLAQIVSGERGAVVFCWLMTLILISSANAAVLAATRVLFAWWYAGHPAFPYRTGGDWFSTFWIVYAGIGGNHAGKVQQRTDYRRTCCPWVILSTVASCSSPVIRSTDCYAGTLQRLRPTEFMLKIVLAETDMQYQQVRKLLSELSAWDTAQVSRLGLDAEAAMDFYYVSGEEELPGVYAPPEGRLFFATCSAKPAGCGALRRMTADTCELKRIYVRPEFRGKQIGRQLAETLILAAIEAGYSVMRLETTTYMDKAMAMYTALGFQTRQPYYMIPEGFRKITVHMEMNLAKRRGVNNTEIKNNRP
jgi:GNAT superfamily N-acetyltransferase